MNPALSLLVMSVIATDWQFEFSRFISLQYLYFSLCETSVPMCSVGGVEENHPGFVDTIFSLILVSLIKELSSGG